MSENNMNNEIKNGSNKDSKQNIYSKVTISVGTLDAIILLGIAILIVLVASSV